MRSLAYTDPRREVTRNLPSSAGGRGIADVYSQSATQTGREHSCAVAIARKSTYRPEKGTCMLCWQEPHGAEYLTCAAVDRVLVP